MKALKMSKKINSLFIIFPFTLIFIFLLIIFPDIASSYAQKGIILWYKNILPSMLPFLIFAIFASKIGISDFLTKIFEKPFEKFLKIDGNGAFAIICAAISGYPMGAKIVSELISLKKISLEQGKKILIASNITSPAFILGTVATEMFNQKKWGIIMLLCHYSSAFLLSMLYKSTAFVPSTSDKISALSYIKSVKRNKPISEMFSDSIFSASKTLVSICCFIVIFSICTGFMEYMKIMPSEIFGENFKALDGILISSVEMTNGCKILSLDPTFLNISITCAMISFGGLCIHFQILSLLSKSGIKFSFVFITKLLHALLSFIIIQIISIILLKL